MQPRSFNRGKLSAEGTVNRGLSPASMQPRSFNRGKARPWTAVIRPPALQCSRGLSTAESKLAPDTLSSLDGFNAAAVFQPRKAIVCEGQLWQPSCFNAAAVFQPRKDHTTARFPQLY